MSDQSRHEIIMPALGMTQDTGEILSWHFALGDQVQAADILFEVETDKTTVEVEAGSAGIIVEVRAAAGEAVPVGSIIAIIDSDESAKPAKPSTLGSAHVPISSNVVTQEHSRISADPSKSNNSNILTAGGSNNNTLRPLDMKESGRILASPKAKLAARDKGVSLHQLLAAGIPEPLQYQDVQEYAPGTNSAAISLSLLQARVQHSAYRDFLEWADKQSDVETISGPVWSLFACSAWRYCCAADPLADIHIELEQWSNREADLFSINADRVGLLDIVSYESNGRLEMVVRDMTGTPLTHYQSPNEPTCPSLTVVDDGTDHLSLSLRFQESSLSLNTAMALLNRICQLVEQPLRHLL